MRRGKDGGKSNWEASEGREGEKEGERDKMKVKGIEESEGWKKGRENE